ncbi:MAG: hypothetical protein KBD01_13920 [Acidobacteria bacterium]|nr:hypothetical protein [Acidobacteriota bacterium]
MSLGVHPFLHLLPHAAESPALRRIAVSPAVRQRLLRTTEVMIDREDGFAWVDTDAVRIVLTEAYYGSGDPLDLYLDLLHELTHIRQVFEGHDLWDPRFAYVDRITEIEGYAVAVEEGRRLGLTDEQVIEHLSNPWMTHADVVRLLDNVHAYLNGTAPASG